jgi:hypothetical protein
MQSRFPATHQNQKTTRFQGTNDLLALPPSAALPKQNSSLKKCGLLALVPQASQIGATFATASCTVSGPAGALSQGARHECCTFATSSKGPLPLQPQEAKSGERLFHLPSPTIFHFLSQGPASTAPQTKYQTMSWGTVAETTFRRTLLLAVVKIAAHLLRTGRTTNGGRI